MGTISSYIQNSTVENRTSCIVDLVASTGEKNLTAFWLNGVVTLILIVLGMSGNAALLASLRCNTKRWLPLYYYFVTFAMWNTVLLVGTLALYCLPELYPNAPVYKDAIFAYLNVVGYLLANSAMTASMWLVLCMNVERCIAVSRPFQRVVSEPKRRAKLVNIAVSVLALVYSLPLVFELRVCSTDEDLPPDFNELQDTPIKYDAVKTGLRNNLTYKIIYRMVGHLIFLSLVPFVGVMATSLRILCLIRRREHENTRTRSIRLAAPNLEMQAKLLPSSNAHNHACSRPTSNQKATSSTTAARCQTRCHSTAVRDGTSRTHMTLTFLASKFVICYTLPLLLNILEIILEPVTLREVGLGILVDVSDLMVVIDSAVNAFVYFSWRRNIQFHRLSFYSKNKANKANNHAMNENKRRPAARTVSSEQMQLEQNGN